MSWSVGQVAILRVSVYQNPALTSTYQVNIGVRPAVIKVVITNRLIGAPIIWFINVVVIHTPIPVISPPISATSIRWFGSWCSSLGSIEGQPFMIVVVSVSAIICCDDTITRPRLRRIFPTYYQKYHTTDALAVLHIRVWSSFEEIGYVAQCYTQNRNIATGPTVEMIWGDYSFSSAS